MKGKLKRAIITAGDVDTRKTLTPRSHCVSVAHKEESINEQGINSGSIPDSSLQCEGLGKEKVRSIRTPVVLSSL